ncbi:MAG: hypothetical protein Q9167_006361 [Letrouitia subvulpina]
MKSRRGSPFSPFLIQDSKPAEPAAYRVSLLELDLLVALAADVLRGDGSGGVWGRGIEGGGRRGVCFAGHGRNYGEILIKETGIPIPSPLKSIPHRMPDDKPSPSTDTFIFPRYYAFPPFYTLQPNLQTRLAQVGKWSLLIQRYCQHHRIFKLTLASALDTPLCHNSVIQRRLSLHDFRFIINHMTTPESSGGGGGGQRAEWIDDVRGAIPWSQDREKMNSAFIYWRRLEEWAEMISGWVEETGQKNTVLTVYELLQGPATEGQEFHGMDAEIMQKSLGLLVKRGKAHVFGDQDHQGVKFF